MVGGRGFWGVFAFAFYVGGAFGSGRLVARPLWSSGTFALGLVRSARVAFLCAIRFKFETFLLALGTHWRLHGPCSIRNSHQNSSLTSVEAGALVFNAYLHYRLRRFDFCAARRMDSFYIFVGNDDLALRRHHSVGDDAGKSVAVLGIEIDSDHSARRL